MSEGYIRSVVIDASLDPAVLAACCQMPEFQYQREIDAVIASIMHCTAEEPINGKITFANNGNETDIYNLQLTAKLNDKGNMLILEFVDMDSGEAINFIEMPFPVIRKAFEPHREYREHAKTKYSNKLVVNIEFLESTGEEGHKYAIKELGLGQPPKPQTVTGIGMEYRMQKYLSGLVIALFPNGPYTAWNLVAPERRRAPANLDRFGYK